MANYAATINDDQAKEPFFGVLLFHSLTPGRFHWYLLGTDDMPLVRGTVDCADDQVDTDVCVEDLKQEIAATIGVTAQQIKLIDSSTVDSMSFPDAAVPAE